MRSVVGALVLVGMLALTGCVDGDRLPTLPPTPTSTPIFASEEEALAAAEDAYAAYLEMSNLISSEGGVQSERIAALVTEDRLESELRAFETLRSSNLRVVGAATFDVMEVQRADDLGNGYEVVFYACWDGSGSRVINSDGVDITPGDRIERVVLEVVLVAGSDAEFKLESDEQWPDSGC